MRGCWAKDVLSRYLTLLIVPSWMIVFLLLAIEYLSVLFIFSLYDQLNTLYVFITPAFRWRFILCDFDDNVLIYMEFIFHSTWMSILIYIWTAFFFTWSTVKICHELQRKLTLNVWDFLLLTTLNFILKNLHVYCA